VISFCTLAIILGMLAVDAAKTLQAYEPGNMWEPRNVDALVPICAPSVELGEPSHLEENPLSTCFPFCVRAESDICGRQDH